MPVGRLNIAGRTCSPGASPLAAIQAFESQIPSARPDGSECLQTFVPKCRAICTKNQQCPICSCAQGLCRSLKRLNLPQEMPEGTMAALLTPEQMGMADKLTIGRGPFSGLRLMQNAGGAVAKEILSRYPGCQDFTVLAGPGNNGGDGYVVADLLARAGARVTLYAMAAPKRGTDAFAARELCSVRLLPLEDYVPQSDSVIVDALFGAGLDRAITGTALDAIAKTKAAGSTVVAIDLPSGISGASGAVLGDAFEADLTVTFFRKKPGHVLYPGRALCGQLVVADIGIREDLLDEIGVALFENSPDLWMGGLPAHGAGVHKYARGAVAVFSGGPSSTGAARL
jgi:hydroxyethylthiazole kinase-like uncharacterized protein yjeF